jgi:ribonucleases P/MRP protein subunit RPP40
VFFCFLYHHQHSWFISYLSGRIQIVRFENTVSRPIEVTSGVPQGSHLGPFIFDLVTDDSSNVLNYCHSLKYADDMKIFSIIKSEDDCRKMQSDLANLEIWCKMNSLSLNVDKCFVKSYYRCNKPFNFAYQMAGSVLQRPEYIEDLGVIFDTKLTFNTHLDVKLAKASSCLGFVLRCAREFNDEYVYKSLYSAFVRPIIEHASVVWSPSYQFHIQRIESVQRRFLLRALSGLRWSSPLILPAYENRLQLITLPTLESRRIVAGVCFIFDLLSGRIDAPELLAQVPIHAPPRQLRVSEFLRLPTHRTNYGSFSPLDRMFRLFNAVANLFEPGMSREVFKERVIQQLNRR